MKRYKIYLTVEDHYTAEVEAESEEDAVDKAYEIWSEGEGVEAFSLIACAEWNAEAEEMEEVVGK